jgi:hypothetical protein
MQLLTVKSVLAHHFVNKLVHGRIIGEITGLDGTGVLSLQQKTTSGNRIRAGISSIGKGFRGPSG